MNYNKKYKFISNGTWFKKGSECIVESLWDWDIVGNKTISYERMISHPEKITGIFHGIRICDSEEELHKIGEEYQDGELCSLSEFKVIKL